MKTEKTNLNTPTLASPVGTSYHHHSIDASVKQLKAILGQPTYESNDGGDKVNFEWVRETPNGSVFTVYDYKEYRKLKQNEIVNWHIGGNNSDIAGSALEQIGRALS